MKKKWIWGITLFVALMLVSAVPAQESGNLEFGRYSFEIGST